LKGGEFPVYSTNDLSLAAYLVTRGHKVGLENLGSYCTFTFSPEVTADVAAYLHGALVEARAYASVIRQLKRDVRFAKS
jgi:hypothetical protein